MPADRSWYIASRWQEWEGEAKANLLRVLAVGSYYVVQWTHFLSLDQHTQAELKFHRQTTLLVAAWMMLSLAVLICLQRRIFPAVLKYVSTATDLALLTTLAILGSGPTSPLVLAYFVIIAMSSLRFSVPLIWFATGGAMLSYLLLVASVDKTWFDEKHTTPVISQLMMHVTLALVGITLGQVVRRTRALAEDYAQRVGEWEQRAARKERS